MTSAAHPSVDVGTTLRPPEWFELYREALRLDGQWRRAGALTAAVPVCAGVAVVFGAPTRPALTAAAGLLAVLATLAGGYLWAGPRRRWRQLPDELRSACWSISADGITGRRTSTGRPSTGSDRRLDLSWNDVDRLVVTRRMIVVQLSAGLGTIGLPRRALTAQGERSVVGWADESGAYLLRRRSSRSLRLRS